jgi:hypothetical protein
VFVCGEVHAQRDAPKFKAGDQVEVQDGFEWKKATVVGIDPDTGWIEARLPDSALPRGIPANMRREFGTRPYPPSDVRAVKAPAREATAHPSRTWTDKTGKFSVEAKFERLEGTTVSLMKADGKPVQVPLERLSESDVQYVRGLSDAAQNPFQESAAPASVDLKKADWRSAKMIRPQTFPKWTFTPASANSSSDNAQATSDMELQLGEIPDSKVFFEKYGVYLSDDGRRIFVSRTRGSVGQDEDQYVDVIDVASKSSAGMAALPSKTVLLDALPGENLVMYRPEVFGFGKKTTLTVARLDKQKITPVIQFEPYAHEDWEPQRDIDGAWFLSSDRIMTVNEHGKALTIWDYSKATALVNIPIETSINLKTSLSPDRSLLAVVMQDGIAIIDLTAGRHVATVSVKGDDYGKVEFRGDNRRLAALSDRGITIWDLTTGENVRDVGHSVISRQNALAWAGELLLVDSRYLFDPDRRILLWEYQPTGASHSEASAYRRGRFCMVNKNIQNETSTLLLSSIPHATALDEMKRLPAAAELLVVKPGDAVSIEVDVDPGIANAEEIQSWFKGQFQQAAKGDSERAKIVVINSGGEEKDLIRSSLANALEAAGLRVVDKSDLVVRAICKKQPSQEVAINVDGRWPVRQQDVVRRTITPHASYLEMTLRGDVLWKTGYVARPGYTFFIEQGETLDAALTRLTRPNLNVFKNAKFFAHIARPGKATDNGAYGVSRLTSRGLIDGSESGRDRASF